jgi:hypothetical protein
MAPMRERYDSLIANPAQIEAILLAGAARARQLSAPFMTELRQAVGLRSVATSATAARPAREKASGLPTFKPAALAQQAAYLQDDTPALRQAAASALDQLAEAARAS